MSFTQKVLDCQIGQAITTWNYNYGQIAWIERGVGLGRVTIHFTNGDVRSYAAKTLATVHD